MKDSKPRAMKDYLVPGIARIGIGASAGAAIGYGLSELAKNEAKDLDQKITAYVTGPLQEVQEKFTDADQQTYQALKKVHLDKPVSWQQRLDNLTARMLGIDQQKNRERIGHERPSYLNKGTKEETIAVTAKPFTIVQDQVDVYSPWLIGTLAIYGAAKGVKSALASGYQKFTIKRRMREIIKEELNEELESIVRERVRSELQVIQGGKSDKAGNLSKI